MSRQPKHSKKKWPTIKIEVGIHHVLVEGTLVYRPQGILPTEWEAFWEAVRDLSEGR